MKKGFRCRWGRSSYACETLEGRVLLSTVTVTGTSGPDSWTLEADAGSYKLNGTTVAAPGMTDIVLNGLAGNDQLFLVHTSIPVTFNAGDNDDQLFFSPTDGQASTQITANVGFNGSNGNDLVDVRDFTTTADKTYTFSGASLNWGTPTPYLAWDSVTENVTLYTATGTEAVNVNSMAFPVGITVQGSTGSDTVSADLTGLTGTLGFVGGNGAGVDALNVTDTAIGPITYTVNGALSSISRSGRTVNYAGLENISLTGPTASGNTYNVSGGTSSTSLALNGGAGSDNFVLTSAQFGNVAIAGGGGSIDSLSFDDHAQPVAMFQADLGADYMNRFYNAGGPSDPLNYAISYNGIEALGYTAKNSTTAINVYGTPSSIPAGQQATILCGSNADTVTLYPHDANGNLTINGNLGVNGGSGVDQLVVDDTASSVPIDYVFQNTFGSGTQNIYGMGSFSNRGLGTAGVENMIVKGGSGEDHFHVNQFTSGIGLAIYGGPGYDECSIAEPTGNIETSITSISSFLYDGQSGDDHFNIYNQNNTGGWNYNRFAGYTFAHKNGVSPTYQITFNHVNCGYMAIVAGAAVDQFNVWSTPFNSNSELLGGGGNDSYVIGQSGQADGLVGLTANILGTVSCGRDQNGVDTVVIRDEADTVARTVHITPTYIGDSQDDTLFGSTDGAIDIGDIKGLINLQLGSGADSVYAQPGARGTLFIHGNAPTTAPGDSMNVATATLANPVYHNTGGGTGNFTYTGSNGFSFDGFETVNTDNVRPTVLSQDFVDNGAAGQAVVAQFSEKVSASLYPGWVQVVDQTNPFGWHDAESLQYDAATNTATFTFSSLPAGRYYIYFSVNRIRDQYGNPMGTQPARFNFTWAIGTGGDDVFRVARDPNTFESLLYENDDTTPALVGAADTAKVVIAAGTGNDSLTVDATDGNPVPPGGGVLFEGGDDVDTVGVRVTDLIDAVSFDAGAVAVDGGVVANSDVENLRYEGSGGHPVALSVNAGSVATAGAERFESVSIADAATLVVDVGSNSVLIARSLAVSPSARLDLTDNDFILDYDDAAATSPAAAVEALVASGFNFGDWLGYGVTSSTAADPANNGNYALGVAENALLVNPFGDGTTETNPRFAGQTVDATAVLIKFTHRVDLDLDGLVSSNDAAVFNGAFSEGDGGATWMSGDVDFDGVYSSNDAAIFNSFYDEALAQL